MQGPELGVQADDIEAAEIEREPKQEVLENKDVRGVLLQHTDVPPHRGYPDHNLM